MYKSFSKLRMFRQYECQHPTIKDNVCQECKEIIDEIRPDSETSSYSSTEHEDDMDCCEPLTKTRIIKRDKFVKKIKIEDKKDEMLPFIPTILITDEQKVKLREKVKKHPLFLVNYLKTMFTEKDYLSIFTGNNGYGRIVDKNKDGIIRVDYCNSCNKMETISAEEFGELITLADTLLNKGVVEDKSKIFTSAYSLLVVAHIMKCHSDSKDEGKICLGIDRILEKKRPSGKEVKMSTFVCGTADILGMRLSNVGNLILKGYKAYYKEDV